MATLEDRKANLAGGRPLLPEAEAPWKATPFPKIGSLMYALQGYFVFLVLRIQNRPLLHEISALAFHLEKHVFPSLRETRGQWLTLELVQDETGKKVFGRSSGKHFSFPGTSHLARQMKRTGLERITLSSSLKYYQVIETILILAYVTVSPEGDESDRAGMKRYTGWNRKRIAARMLSKPGFHRFCTVMRLRPWAKEYVVEYSYCEPYFSRMVQGYVGRDPKFDDHMRLFRAAPKMGLMAFLICMLPLSLLHVHATAAAIVWISLSGFVSVALGLSMRMIGSMQFVREHRETLIGEYLNEISVLSRFPESNPNPQIKLSVSGTVLYANRATQQLLAELGFDEDAVAEILPPQYKEILAACLNGKEDIHEAEVQTRGKTLRFRFSAFPDGQSFIASGSDVTHLKNVESELRDSNLNLEETVEVRTEELSVTQEVIILSLAGLAEMRDPETGAHLERTRRFVRILAQKLRSVAAYKAALTKDAIHALYMSAPLHDIGKVGIPDAVLLKPGKLTFDEFEVMKKHAAYGAEVLQKAANKLGFSSFLDTARNIAYYHHEKWDGSGYPSGLEGDAIPLPARIMALADVYDALTSKRPYKEPWSHERTRELITEERGKHFDPAVVDAFLDGEDEFISVARVLREADG